MASLFIEGLDGKPINISLIQTVYLDPEDNKNVVFQFINGEIFKEELDSESSATNRLANIIEELESDEGGGSQPTGTIDIVNNGIHNVSSYANANVNVPQLDTSDATATRINIRDSKTAYVNGQKITGTLPVITYPVNPENPKDWNYQFIAGDSALNTVRDGVTYLVGSYQIAAENKPDSWMFEGNRKMKLGIPFSLVSSTLGVTANKIKKGETIAGVIGTYEGVQPNLQDKSETITTNTTTTIQADNGYDGLGTVTIITDVGGASYPPDWSQIGYTNTPQTILDTFAYSKNISDNWDSTQSILYNKFSRNSTLVYMPLVDTHNAVDMNSMFSNCSNLQIVPSLNSSKVTDMYRMFYYCQKLISVGELNAIQVTRMEDMFSNCNKLEQFSIINTDNVTNMRNMFNNCIKLTSISLPNTPKLQNASQMFFNCSSLTTITQLDTSKVTQATQMFQGCTSLVTIPQLDISAVTNSYYIQNMFNSCNSLSDESLNNILAMCINAGVKSTLAYIGLSQTQATTCQTLSNWQDFVDAGWTTGY